MVMLFIVVFMIVIIVIVNKRKKRSDVRKIYKTTDGYFTQNPKIKKRRRVVVVKQRKTDGALAVCKIYSKEEKKKGTRYIKDLTLSPKKHKSLTRDSIIGSQPIIGTKGKDGKYKAIHTWEFESTNDKLTKKEHRAVMSELGGDNEKYNKTANDLLKKWENHFQ